MLGGREYCAPNASNRKFRPELPPAIAVGLPLAKTYEISGLGRLDAETPPQCRHKRWRLLRFDCHGRENFVNDGGKLYRLGAEVKCHGAEFKHLARGGFKAKRLQGHFNIGNGELRHNKRLQ